MDELKNGETNQKHIKLLDHEKSALFWSNLSYQKINNIAEGLSDLETRDNITQNDINLVRGSSNKE